MMATTILFGYGITCLFSNYNWLFESNKSTVSLNFNVHSNSVKIDDLKIALVMCTVSNLANVSS